MGCHELTSVGLCSYGADLDGTPAVVSVLGRQVRVHAVAAEQVRRTAKLLAEINEQNAASWWTRTYWAHEEVVIEATMPWQMVDMGSLGFSIDQVVETAARIGPMLTAVHGGSAVIPASAGWSAPQSSD